MNVKFKERADSGDDPKDPRQSPCLHAAAAAGEQSQGQPGRIILSEELLLNESVVKRARPDHTAPGAEFTPPLLPSYPDFSNVHFINNTNIFRTSM